MDEKENSQTGGLKVSWNGQELSGEQAKVVVEQLMSKLTPKLPGSLGNMVNSFSKMNKAASIPQSIMKNVSDVGDLSKMLPVFDVSKDMKKMKMTLNGQTLFDLDFAKAFNQSDDSSDKS